MSIKKRLPGQRERVHAVLRETGSVCCAALVLALLLAVPSYSAELRDQTGRMVNLPDTARRIVSLAPNITELLFALGAGNAVAGSCQHSNYPPEALSLPRVGSYFRPNLERIVALRPDLCLAVKDGTPVIVLQRLEQLGIPVFILDPQSLESLREALLLLGTALNRQRTAEKLVSEMNERLVSMDAAVAAHIRLRGQRPTVLVRVQANPFMAAARGTYPAELVERSGGRVPLNSVTLYPRLSTEDLLALNPDIILAPEAGAMCDQEASQQPRKEFLPGAATAILIHSVPEDLMFRPSLRSLDAMDRIAELLWQQSSPVAALGRGIR